MDNENSTAFEETQSGEQAEVVASPEREETQTDAAGQGHVVDASEGGDAKAEDAEGEEGTASTEQSREENAAIRAARLRERRRAEAEAKQAAEERFARAGVMNPMTGKPFRTLDEWDEYASRIKAQTIAEKAKKTGRSVEELTEEEENRAFIAELRRDAKKRKAEQDEEAKRRDFLQSDLADFMEKHPSFGTKEIAALEGDKKFRRFCGSRYGKEPLSELYDAYVEIVGEAGKAAVVKSEARAARSTGSGTTGGGVLSPSQRKDLDAWNEAHPEMQMTAKEFLAR